MEMRGSYNGPITISDMVDLYGMVASNVTVANGAKLRMHGLVSGDLIVQQGAIAMVAGTVNGAVINHGGDVRVSGLVGSIKDVGATRTQVEPEAIVREK